MAGNPVWGVICDRIGVRRAMMIAVGGWTLASTLHAFASTLLAFAILRGKLGFFEGATFPGSLRTVVQTLAPNERARGVAISYSGGSLGAILTPFLVTPIALAFGWRAAFLATGVAGVFWLVAWSGVSRRAALRHPAATAREAVALNWRHPHAWAFVAIYALGALPLGFILYMSSIYLTKVFQTTQAQLGMLLWIPPLGWECGYFFWGWALDRGTPASRIFSLCFLLSLPFAAAGELRSLPLFMAALFLQMFLCGGSIVGGIAFATKTFGHSRSGLIAGLGAGSFSLLTALTAPWFGSLLDRGNYAESFYVATAFPAAGYLLWRMLTSRPTAAA
jgi:ACS family hexuronate transporter-like MFS transporter